VNENLYHTSCMCYWHVIVTAIVTAHVGKTVA